MRANPGPFEPFIYLLQTPIMYRVVGIGGFILFTITFFAIAADHSDRALLWGVILLGAFWVESSASICRRCRFYGTWHCLGQGRLVSVIFPPIRGGIGEFGVMRHAAFAAVYILYGLFWLWHQPLAGFLFTLWVPAAFITATTPAGFSWRAKQAA
jgi:hypothetical protein